MRDSTPYSENDFLNSVAGSGEDDAEPCAEAMLAGTLALMTGHARCGCAQHRDLMASKAAANLAQLAQHPLLSEGFRTVAFNLHVHWVELVQAERIHQGTPAHNAVQSAADKAASVQLCRAELARAEQSRAELSRALWHTTPEVIQ